MRSGALSLAVLLGGVNAACINYRPAPAPLSREVAGATPAERWQRQVGRALSGTTALDSTTFYVGGYDRFVYAVALDSAGKPRWKRRLTGAVVGGVQARDGTLYVATSAPDGRVYALRASDGGLRWQQRDVREISAPLALAEGLVIALDEQGLAIALDTARGAIRWRRYVGVGRAAPLPDDSGHVVVATVDSLVRLDARTGIVLARAATPGSIVAPLVPAAGAGGASGGASAGAPAGALLLASSTDSLLVAFDPATLRVRWRARLDAPATVAPLLVGDTAWVVTRVGTLYRLALGAPQAIADTGSVAPPVLATGAPAAPRPGGDDAAPHAAATLHAERVAALRWPVTAPLARLGDLLVVGGADGTLRALRHDGTEAWRLGLWAPVELAPVPLADGFIAIGGNADIHRYGP